VLAGTGPSFLLDRVAHQRLRSVAPAPKRIAVTSRRVLPLLLRRPFIDHTATRGLLFALPILLCFAPLAASWALPLVTLAIIWQAHEEDVLAVGTALAEGWAWYPLLVVLAASSLWALDRQAALLLAARVAGLILCAILLAGTLRRLAPTLLDGLLTALGWGMAAAAFVVAADLAAGTPLIRLLHGAASLVPPADAYSRGAVFQAIATVPLALALWRNGRRRLAVGQLVLVALAAGLGVQAAAKLALLCGMAAGATVLVWPALRWLPPVTIVIFAIALPWALPISPSPETTCWLAEHKPSGLHRVLIWNWVDARIREKPALGWGLDASRRMPGGTEHVAVRGCDDPPDRLPRLDNEVLPLHPHDAALQIWLELGGLGIAAAAAAVASTAAGAFRRWRGRDAAPLAAMLSASAAAALLSFGIWQEWWLASLGLAAGIAIAATRAIRPP